MKTGKVVEILSRGDWDDFVVANSNPLAPAGEFLQSWLWGDFQSGLGRKTRRFKIESGGRTMGQYLLIKHFLPFISSRFGKFYFYCPRGPILDFSQPESEKKKILKLFLKEIIGLAKEEKAVFLRIEPLNNNFLSAWRDSGLRVVSTSPVQPRETSVLNIDQSEQEILALMHPKTRYNIRLAEKRGVKIREASGERDINDFLRLIRQTAEREKFKPHSDDYYRRLSKLNSAFFRFYLAEYKNKTIAAYFVIFFGKTVSYIHGASTRQDKEAMAPHLLHWEIIKRAKEEGFKFYDFWGVDETKWPGMTRFKMSFGGKKIVYPGTFDLPVFKIWYRLYRLGRGIKRI